LDELAAKIQRMTAARKDALPLPNVGARVRLVIPVTPF
jgi:hypothetical protein